MSLHFLLGTNKVNSALKEFVRNASKKTGGSTQNTNCKVKPKRRGWKVQDGHFVQPGHMLATQRTPRFHPGLNVGFGRNATLFAMEPGKVVVTCEKFDPCWDHTWVKRTYGGREDQTIMKKYFNVIPEPQHQRFKLVDELPKLIQKSEFEYFHLGNEIWVPLIKNPKQHIMKEEPY